MARIIKKGKKKQKVFRGTCRDCESIIEEDANKLHIIYDRDGPMAKLTCPVCNKSMWLYPYEKKQNGGTL